MSERGRHYRKALPRGGYTIPDGFGGQKWIPLQRGRGMLDRFVRWVEGLKTSGRWRWVAAALAVLATAIASYRLLQRMKAAAARTEVMQAKASLRTLSFEQANLSRQREVAAADVESLQAKIKEQKEVIATAYAQEGMSSRDIASAFEKLGY